MLTKRVIQKAKTVYYITIPQKLVEFWKKCKLVNPEKPHAKVLITNEYIIVFPENLEEKKIDEILEKLGWSVRE